MSKIKKVLLAALLICTASIVYSMVKNPLGDHNMFFILAVLAGFIWLDADRKKLP